MPDAAPVSRLARYLHADTIGGSILDYLVYRVKATECWLAPPRLGHTWSMPENTSMHQVCRVCGKEWWANW